MNSPKGVKSGVSESVSTSAPHVAPVTIHEYQSYVTVGEQTPHVAPVTIYPKQLETKWEYDVKL